jgi:chromosome segregation ATPase
MYKRDLAKIKEKDRQISLLQEEVKTLSDKLKEKEMRIGSLLVILKDKDQLIENIKSNLTKVRDQIRDLVPVTITKEENMPTTITIDTTRVEKTAKAVGDAISNGAKVVADKSKKLLGHVKEAFPVQVKFTHEAPDQNTTQEG